MSLQTPHPTADRDLRRWLKAHRIVVRGLTLADFIGSPRAVREVESLAAMLREPDLVAAAGGTMVRGVIFHGPPGVGKTHLARIMGALLGDAVPFFETSAAELTERRVSALARYFAAHPAPAVLYIDEIDAVALERGSRIHDRRSRGVMYALLSTLDGLRDGGRVLYLASTNTEPAYLDRSLMRSGRFGRTVRLELPTLAEREAIFAYHGARRALAEPIDYARAAELTRGRSGADLVAALDDGLALGLADGGRGRDGLTWQHLEESIVRKGAIDESPALSLDQRKRQAIHESAHCQVARELLGAGAISGVTLGDHRGGRTELGPDDGSRPDLTEEQLLARVAVLVAGAIGERQILGSGSLGGGTDASKATELLLARLDAGADPAWGSLSCDAFGMQAGPALLDARSAAVRTAIDAQAERAGAILARRRDAVVALADILLVEGTLSGTALQRALGAANPDEPELGAA